MKILLTGASSFTGLWFAQRLASRGHQVTATLTRPPGDYDGLRGSRVKLLEKSAGLRASARFGEEAFLRLMEREGPWDLFCHHAAQVANYRSPAFDALEALSQNVRQLDRVLALFKNAGGKAMLLTGTVFEPDEGAGNEPRSAFSPYGLSKGLTWHYCRYYAERGGLTLGKFVIPNPFGPWEEPRFTGYLIQTWKTGKIAEVKTPDYIRDNIPVDLLAECYARFAESLVAARPVMATLNPSGYVESQGAFARRFAEQMRARLPLECGLRCLVQTEFNEPWMRINHDPARARIPDWDENGFWDQTAVYYRQAYEL